MGTNDHRVYALSQSLQASAPSSREHKVLRACLRRLVAIVGPAATLLDEHERPMKLSLNGAEPSITCSCGSHVLLAAQPAPKAHQA